MKKLKNYGRKNSEKNYSKFPIKLPVNSAPIVSDYKSKWGAGSSPGKRKKKHLGVDFYLKPGSPILAANDGVVLFAKYLKCEGNVMTIKHTGNLYASYLHIGDFKVKIVLHSEVEAEINIKVIAAETIQ